MKNLSTVKSDLRKSALKILTFKCCMLIYSVFKESIGLLDCLATTSVDQSPWYTEPLWTRWHCVLKLSLGWGHHFDAQLSLLLQNHQDIFMQCFLQFRFASCSSKSSCMKVHLERRGHGCDWWCWEFILVLFSILIHISIDQPTYKFICLLISPLLLINTFSASNKI